MSGFRIMLTAALVCVSAFGAEDIVPADRPPAFVPLGAYLSWERPGACAAHYGVERWDDVCLRLDALQANHVNLLWVTNMSQADLPRLITECEKRGMFLLPSMGVVEARVDWRWVEDGAYYDKTLPGLVKLAGDSKTLIGWVLSDEPQEQHFARLEDLRLRMRKLDPNRFCTTVLMWPHAPLLPEHAALPVVCVDLYPFFGPKDPNGPHTDAASKSFFRRNALKMLEAIDEDTADGWIMGMCFSDIWGPKKYNEKGHLIGLPGSYLHWRCPTLAEMRWQVWETFRSGARGYVCYTLAPEAPNPESAAAPPCDVKWKEVLAKEPTDLGPNALTNPDASVTPQLEELGRTYALLTPHTGLIQRWAKTDDPAIEVDGAAQVQSFVDPQDGKTYAVVLNDDLKKPHEVALRLGESVAAITDIVRKKEAPLTLEFAGGSSTTRVRLQAGEGTILLVERRAPKE